MPKKGTVRELQEQLRISKQTVKGLSEYCDKYQARIKVLEEFIEKMRIERIKLLNK